MQRTQIYFPKQLHEDLKIGAKMMGTNVSEYIRKILNESLYVKPARKKAGIKKANPLIIAENGASFGIKDLARNFDKYFEASLK